MAIFGIYARFLGCNIWGVNLNVPYVFLSWGAREKLFYVGDKPTCKDVIYIWAPAKTSDMLEYYHETLRNDRGDTKNDDFWYTCLLILLQTLNPQERWGTHKKRWLFQPRPFSDVIGLYSPLQRRLQHVVIILCFWYKFSCFKTSKQQGKSCFSRVLWWKDKINMNSQDPIISFPKATGMDHGITFVVSLFSSFRDESNWVNRKKHIYTPED